MFQDSLLGLGIPNTHQNKTCRRAVFRQGGEAVSGCVIAAHISLAQMQTCRALQRRGVHRALAAGPPPPWPPHFGCSAAGCAGVACIPASTQSVPGAAGARPQARMHTVPSAGTLLFLRKVFSRFFFCFLKEFCKLFISLVIGALYA